MKKVLPEDENTLQIMERTQTPLILFGHTHVRTRIAGKDRLAINPGSAGISYRSGGKAQYLLLHGRNGGWEEEPVSLPYDTDRVIRELHESGLYRHAPYWCVAYGEHSCGSGGCPMERCWQGLMEAFGTQDTAAAAGRISRKN